MKLKLITHSPNVEAVVATSMLTTTSGAQPSVLYERLLNKPEKVKEIVSRIEVQHGNILEHNRFIWELEASVNEVLEIFLYSCFFKVTKLGDQRWIISANLRTIIEYSHDHSNAFIKMILDSVNEAAPQIHEFMKRGSN